MKLYKEASLMMLPTSVKDGKLYSIFPQPKPLSGELITNGGFDDGSSWGTGTGWSIGGGKASFDGSTAFQQLQQIDVTQQNKNYKLTFNLSNVGSSVYRVRLISGGSYNKEISVNGDGTYVAYFVSNTGLSNTFGIQNDNNTGSSYAFDIDNISVVEVDQLPADFDFSRGSNLAATRINEQGLIEKGRENLLLQSNQFDTTWTTFNATPTGGQSGYDGSSDAWLLNATGASGSLRQDISQSGVQTFSVYVKQGTADAIEIDCSITGVSVKVDLSDGSEITSGASTINTNIESIGSSWYRISVTGSGSATVWRMYVKNADNSAIGSGDNIYIQDAQLEVGLVATDYIESGATTGKAGVLEDLPRLNWGGNCPSLLLEPQRTNSLGQSEYFDGDYVKFATGITYDTNTSETTSPEGLYNATKLISSTNNEQQAIYKNIAVATPTFTCYAKAGEFDTFALKLSASVFCNFTLTGNGSIGNNANTSDKSITPVGNGWYRCSISATTNSSYAWIAITSGNIQGDGTSGIYIYGAQLEEGSYATSYIPTHGTSVTRSKDDIVEKADVGVTREDFTILFDIDLNNTVLSSNVRVVDLKDSSGTAQQEIRFFQFGGEHTFVPYFKEDSTYAFGTGDNDMRFDGRVIFRADGGGSYSMFFGFNGVSTKKVATGLTPYVLNKISFVEEIITIGIKELTIWNTALSDNECINLTTI